ncbi:tRNA (adenosine(37)-N6)-dimethylallyltransferase MiaA [Vampirovibrio chlorellavorus]|uniref:tRNA (adenosine(37)-N6)-dimethylallyltransferase MiaA n=1 Tax=Vampirovibrio chlorellavorus TaxID=758823 RepID=UPI0026F1ECE8|nr:tRNA (adenosine(37)-N6)-dimethylallyltransferase MiaA [Vampirovibrio chlorellavorus]
MSASARTLSLPRVIAILGPTATGKTALSVEIAQWLGTEIISADSQLIYRELTIGTAKPSPEERGGIPHHLIDVAEPTEAYSAANYQTEASAILKILQQAGKIPVVTGGTGFYLKALLQADFIPGVPPNADFREAMHRLAQQHGSAHLHDRLKALDPIRAAALHPNDTVRIIRALEIIEATGLPVPNAPVQKSLDVLWLGLMYQDRDLLRARIDQRIEAMMQAGWLAEVESLVRRYGPQAHALHVAHGYPELMSVALGECTLPEALERVRLNIHQYSRRQMTWFRRNPEIHWLACDTLNLDERLEWAKARISQWLTT